MSAKIVIQGGGGGGTVGISPRTHYGNIVLEGNRQLPPVYEGPTTVTPEAWDAQILQTENRIVKENILVLPIPYSETSNPQGGKTIYIGD